MLAILLGDAQGAERERAEVLAETLPTAHVVTSVPAEASAVLLAGGQHPDTVLPDVPTLAWVTGDVLVGRRSWPEVDGLLVPSASAAWEALRRGYRRASVHVVSHPVSHLPRPALRSAAVEGAVGLVTAEHRTAELRGMLERLPAVSSVVLLGNRVSTHDAAADIDAVSVVLFATVSQSGASVVALMERGLPVIAWEAGAAADLIIDGLCGWLVRAEIAAMRAAVHGALADRWHRESAGIAARDRVLARSSRQALIAGVASAVAAVSECNPRVRPARAVGAT